MTEVFSFYALAVVCGVIAVYFLVWLNTRRG